MPAPYNINVNDEVEVVLTEAGLEHYNESMHNHAASLRSSRKLRIQLWELMRIFGPMFIMGSRRLPFEDNNIDIQP